MLYEVTFPNVVTLNPTSMPKNVSESPNKKGRLHKNLTLALGNVLLEKSNNYNQMQPSSN